MLNSGVHQVLDILFPSYIGRNPQGLLVRNLPDQTPGVLNAFHIDICHHHLAALPGQAQADRLPEPLPAAGHNRSFPS